jgi:hypothetical protein
LIFFSDEKNFLQDQTGNFRNHRWLCDEPSEVPIVMKTKFPVTLMILQVVSNKGNIMPPPSHIFKAGLRVNMEVYINVLTNVTKPWMDGVAAGRSYIWQQDGTPPSPLRSLRMVQGQPPLLLEEGGLASHLTRLHAVGLFCVGCG